MEVGVSRLFLLYRGGSMKQITNKEYEEWMKYKEEKAKGHILLPDTIRFICEPMLLVRRYFIIPAIF